MLGRLTAAVIHMAFTMAAGIAGMRLAMSVEYGGEPMRHPGFVYLAFLIGAVGMFAVMLEIRRAYGPDPDVTDLRRGRVTRVVCALFGGLILSIVALRCVDSVGIYDPTGGKDWFVMFLASSSFGCGSAVVLHVLNRRVKRRWFYGQGLTCGELPRARARKR